MKHALGIINPPQAAEGNIEMKLTKPNQKVILKDKCKLNQGNYKTRSDDVSIYNRPLSPRRLMKQVALESPPHLHEFEDQHSIYKHMYQDHRGKIYCNN